MAEVEDLDPPIGSEQKGTDGEIRDSFVEVTQSNKTESKDARYFREQSWDAAWNQYNGLYDFTDKAPWQSKNTLWWTNTAVRSAVYLLAKGLVGAKDFFQTEGFGDVGKNVAPFIHSLTKFHFQTGNFVRNYKTALTSGMLANLVILKIYPQIVPQVETMPWNRSGPALPSAPVQGTNTIGNLLGTPNKFAKSKKHLVIRYDPVDAYNFYPDPYGENLYKIHEIPMDLWKLREMAKNPKNHFNMDAVNAVTEDFIRAEKEARENNRKGENQVARQALRKRCQLDEFWGTLTDSAGNVLFTNCYGVMLNEKYPLVEPRPNPMPNGLDPFVVGPVIEKAFSTWHQGFTESIQGIQNLGTELLNLIMDGNLFNSIKAFEIDMDQVYDPNEFLNGIYPGKTFKKRSMGATNGPMIKDITVGSFNAQQGEIYSLLTKEFNQATGLNEFTGSVGGSTKRMTKQEAAANSQKSMDFFGEIARVQEEQILEPALYKTYTYLLHYQTNFDDPILIELMGEQEARKAQILLSNKDIKDFLASAPVKYMATGMTGIIGRAQELQKIMAFINLTGNLAKAMPQILQRVDILEILKNAIYALNWDPSKVLVDDKKQDPTGTPPLSNAPGEPQPGGGQGVPPSPGRGVDQFNTGGDGRTAMSTMAGFQQ